MKFSIVIGNPPYNKGMDLDFVNIGCTLSNEYTTMIVPAKWQTAEEDQKINSKDLTYGAFRNKVVSHMRYVVFYPDSRDVFSTIDQSDGVTYFLIDKDIHKECIVENKCKLLDYFNSKEVRTIQNREVLNNVANKLNEMLSTTKKYEFDKITGNKRYSICMNTKVILGKTDKSLLVSSENNLLVFSICRILDVNKDDYYESTVSQIIFEADTIEECYNFLSWLYSKFTRFFVATNISKLTNIYTNDCFRFVPAPPSWQENSYETNKWNHRYTDDELYKYFNIPDEYIKIIESFIKQRTVESALEDVEAY